MEATNFATVDLVLPAGRMLLVKEAAALSGVSFNAYVLTAVAYYCRILGFVLPECNGTLAREGALLSSGVLRLATVDPNIKVRIPVRMPRTWFPLLESAGRQLDFSKCAILRVATIQRLNGYQAGAKS